MRTDPMELDPREERLPAWARTKIANLRRVARSAMNEAAETRLATNPDDSDAVLRPYDDIPIGLGEWSQVQFKLGGGRAVLVYRDREQPGRLKLMATGDNSNGSLIVHPRVTNVISVEVS